MFKKFTKKNKQTALEAEIAAVLEIMKQHQPDSAEYKKMTDNLEKLYKMDAIKREQKIKKDTILIIAGNLLGIALILGFEQAGVITTKALGFIIKGRV